MYPVPLARSRTGTEPPRKLGLIWKMAGRTSSRRRKPRAQNPKLVLPGRDPPLLGGGERGGGLSPAGKLGDRNVDAASDSGRSERKIDLAIKLIRKKIANDLHSIARPVWSLDGGATAFLPFDA